MNDHNEDIEFLLSQYLDGELSAAQRADLERRLASDESLRTQFELMRLVDARVQELSQVEIDGIDYDLQRSNVMSALERKVLLDHKKPLVLLLRPAYAAMAAAACIVIAVTAFLVFPSGRPSVGGDSLIVRNPTPGGDVTVTVLNKPTGNEGSVSVKYPRPDLTALVLPDETLPNSPSAQPSGKMALSAASLKDSARNKQGDLPPMLEIE